MNNLSERDALTVYARMLNTCDSDEFESLLHANFKAVSQFSFVDLGSREVYVAYVREKLKTIKLSNDPLFAELGILPAWGHKECVVIAQSFKENLVAVAYLTIESQAVTKLDICAVPSPYSSKRTGYYPGLPT